MKSRIFFCISLFVLIFPTYLLSQNADSIIAGINFASGDNETRYNALIDTGEYYSNRIVDLTIRIGQEAVKYEDFINDPESKSKVFKLLGKAYSRSGDYAKSVDCFYRIIEILNENGDKYSEKLADAYLNLGETYRATQDYTTAMTFITKAYNMYSELSDENGIAHALNREAAVDFEVAVNANDTNKILKVIETANKSLAISEKANEYEYQISTLNIIAACYSFLGDVKIALNLYNKALAIADSSNNHIDVPNILNNMASMYYESLKDYNKCIEYALRSYKEAVQTNIPVYKFEASFMLFQAYKEKGELKNALYYLEQYLAVNTDLYNFEKTNRIKETEKKIEEANRKLDNEKRTRQMIIFAAFFLIIVIILLFYIMKEKALKKLNANLNEKNKIISEQNSELENLIQNQNIFFSILSHDLRSPFQSILGFLHLLESDFDKLSDEEKKEYLGYVSVSSEKIYNLVVRLLEWSRIQGGQLKCNFEKVNPKHIVDELSEMHASNLSNKKLVLENLIPEDLNVIADANFTSTILRNLLDNAIKFSNEISSIKIYSKILKGMAQITVEDSGTGIPPENIPNLFRIDKKVLTKGTYMEEGTGLGLKLVHQMIEKMNGTLKVESEVGKGTKFIFTLPTAV